MCIKSMVCANTNFLPGPVRVCCTLLFEIRCTFNNLGKSLTLKIIATNKLLWYVLYFSNRSCFKNKFFVDFLHLLYPDHWKIKNSYNPYFDGYGHSIVLLLKLLIVVVTGTANLKFMIVSNNLKASNKKAIKN